MFPFLNSSQLANGERLENVALVPLMPMSKMQPGEPLLPVTFWPP